MTLDIGWIGCGRHASRCCCRSSGAPTRPATALRNVLTGGEFGPVLGIHGSYMTAPTYFEGEPDYTGFCLHHCVHYMDLVPWLAGAGSAEMALRRIEPAPGKLLFHLNFTAENGVIGTVVMGTVQSRGTPMEFVQVIGDQNRVEVTNVIDVAW